MRDLVRIAAVLTCFSLIQITTSAQESDIERKELRRAQVLYEGKKYQEAAAVLETLCGKQPALADAHRLLGHVYHHLGRPEDERKALAQAVAHGRLTPDVLARLALIDQKQNHTAALLSGLHMRMLVEPQDRAWSLFHADILSSVGAVHEAEYFYTAILESDPLRPDVYVRLGNLCLRKERHERAASLFETAYHLGESKPGLPRTIAELWFKMGDRRQALRWYERAIELQKEPAEKTRFRWAELLFWAGEFSRAEVVLRSLVHSGNRGLTGKARLLLGQIAMKRKEPLVAAVQWEKAVQAGIQEPRILSYLGSHYFNRERYKKAAGCLERRLAGGMPDRVLLEYLIISLARSGEQDRALDWMQTYLEHFGLDDKANRLVVTVLLDKRDGGKEDRKR